MIRAKIPNGDKHRIVIFLFFVALLYVGLAIFRDYGISWDEDTSRLNGITAIRYVLEGDEALFTYRDKYHGPAFEIFLVAVERILGIEEDPRTTYLMRHLVTFLVFYAGVICFYLLCSCRYKSWKIGIVGSVLLILSPRIFAHSFYNSKDLSFLAFFIISIFTLIRYLDNRTVTRAVFHALACAFLIDIRIAGIIVPLFTLCFSIADMASANTAETRHRRKADTIGLLIYLSFLIFFVVLFWPTLWPNPVHHFISALKEMSHYPHLTYCLYLGKYISSFNLPWHYIPVWMIITTPILYTVCFLAGCLFLIESLSKDPKRFYLDRRDDCIFLLWFFVPLAAVILFRSVLYDAWRQMFFIYPAFLLIALSGLLSLSAYFKVRFKGLSYKIINAGFIFIIILNLVFVARFVIIYHPYQNLYFNRLAGRDMQEIKNNFELDYWGLSYRKALEYILKNDRHDTIKLYTANLSGKRNVNILDVADRRRLVFVEDPDEAQYFLSEYRWHKDEYSYKEEYYSIKIGGTKIMVVYRI